MNISTLKSVRRGQPALPISCCYLKGSNVCLHSYTFVFSLQKDEEMLSFEHLLQHDTTDPVINEELFEGFSFISHTLNKL
jgi:hypothetical protein